MKIFLTTQYLKEADEPADKIAIIVEGRIAQEGSPSKLKAALGAELINLSFESIDQAEKAEIALDGMGDQIQIDRVLFACICSAAQAIPSVVNRLQQASLDPISLTLTPTPLDDVFLQVTGQRMPATDKKQAQPA